MKFFTIMTSAREGAVQPAPAPTPTPESTPEPAPAETPAPALEVINMTPHALNVHGVNGEVTTIAPSGAVARVNTAREQVGVMSVNGAEVAVFATTFGEVEGLPDPEPGKVFIVSALVLSALNGARADVVAPGELVRDNEGRVIGCRGFTR